MHLYADLRLYRSLVNTEITTSATRFDFTSISWTIVPSGELDENGEPLASGFVNDGNVVFPKPGLLDLLSVVNHVRLYIGIGEPKVHYGSSPLLGLSTLVVGDAVVFPPGELTITLL
jgi:hypothetical protein